MVGLQRAVTCAVRPWGWYAVVAEAEQEPIVSVRTVVLEPGRTSSFQVDRQGRERWVPLTHGLIAVIGEETCELIPGHLYEIGVGVPRRLLDLAGVGGTVLQLVFGHGDANGGPRQNGVPRQHGVPQEGEEVAR